MKTYFSTGPKLISCLDRVGSCQRATCECDRLFAIELENVGNVFNRDNHIFWSRSGFDPEEKCLAQETKAEPECCGSRSGPFEIYNSVKMECCDDQTVKPIGMC